MGSGSSVPTCPKGYDKQKFRTIQKLFDEIDDNSNFHIDTGDQNKLVYVARNVVTNKASYLQRVNAQKETEMNQIEANKRREFERELEAWKTKYGADVRRTKGEIVKLHNMTNEEACNYFIKEAGKGKLLTFPRFFEYMKDNV